jgi:MoxR-like ATPase
MPQARPRTRTRRAASTPAARRFCLADLGVYGFDRHETTILAALVTEDPLLLVGRSGTGKTFLLNTLSEALGLEHRHYNASLISFDDLVGFPYPDETRATVRFLETPATVWGAESVLIDEISRCKPEHQNRLFSLVHERRLQGLPLQRLRYRWAAMNPCTADQGGVEDYSGSEPLDPALAGSLPVGAEGVNDLAKLAVPLMDVEGEIAWQERRGEQGTSHPAIAEIAKVLAPLADGRLARAKQFLTACLLRNVRVTAAAELEQQMDACVTLIRERGLVGGQP